ncbi:hypothetical protein LTR86_000380 [Recurvomyces mirabilis]|nr:hypothetical protein LTR86_000380 [Recurvomyces mirabilis]
MYDKANNLELKLWALDSATPYEDYHKNTRSQGSEDPWCELYASPRYDTPLGIEIVAHPNFPYGRRVQALVTYKISGRLTPNYLVLNKWPAGGSTDVRLVNLFDFVDGHFISKDLIVSEPARKDEPPIAIEIRIQTGRLRDITKPTRRTTTYKPPGSNGELVLKHPGMKHSWCGVYTDSSPKRKLTNPRTVHHHSNLPLHP